MQVKMWMLILAMYGLVMGCSVTRPLKPGTSSIRSMTATNGVAELVSEMKQPENPAQRAEQDFERTVETELPIPAQSQVREVVILPAAKAGVEGTRQEKTIVLAEPTVQKTRVTEKAGTVIGAAQKDTAREIGAKLASLKGVVWVGVGLCLFGLASLTYPPLKAVIGSVTTSLAMVGGGVALMALPTLVVGHEMLILGAVGLGVGAWFLAHRHGELRGKIQNQRVG